MWRDWQWDGTVGRVFSAAHTLQMGFVFISVQPSVSLIMATSITRYGNLINFLKSIIAENFNIFEAEKLANWKLNLYHLHTYVNDFDKVFFDLF